MFHKEVRATESSAAESNKMRASKRTLITLSDMVLVEPLTQPSSAGKPLWVGSRENGRGGLEAVCLQLM